METPAQKVARLLTAIEDLTRQETLLLRSGDYPGALQAQQRLAPLVERLVELRAAAGESAQVRVAAIIEQRRSSENWLGTALERGRVELGKMSSNQRRLAQVKPAYAGAASGRHQLSALG